MKIREFELDKLARARELQDEAAALHIPMPILSWEYKITDKNGNISERGTGKANSYTRNALNLLAWNVGFASYSAFDVTGFGDGNLSYKLKTGSFSKSYSGRYLIADNNASYGPRLMLGTGTAETLNDYADLAHVVLPSISSSFNTTTRKLINIISASYYNATGSTEYITESGLRFHFSGATNNAILAVHDVFPAITVPAGATLSWTYVTEIAYPNP